jgi:hypothetical protein
MLENSGLSECQQDEKGKRDKDDARLPSGEIRTKSFWSHVRVIGLQNTWYKKQLKQILHTESGAVLHVEWVTGEQEKNPGFRLHDIIECDIAPLKEKNHYGAKNAVLIKSGKKYAKKPGK